MEGEPIERETLDYEFECSNEKDGRKYNWKIGVTEDIINITITDKTNNIENYKTSIKYRKKYSKKELDEKNQNFLIFNEMTSLAKELEERLTNNTYDLSDNINDITISFKKEDDNKQIRQFDIKVPIRQNSDSNLLMSKILIILKN